MDGDDWLKSIAATMESQREKGAAPTPERLTVRQFLFKFGYFRRGKWISIYIRNKLDGLGIRTVPDFETAWFDATITIELDRDESHGERPDPTHRVAILDAAHNKPKSVAPDSTISVATTLMLLHDYSQLPVMQGDRNVKGVISWKSIGARLSLDRPCEYVRDCMEPAKEVAKETPLLEVIGTVAESGYVLVRDREDGDVICGIVTAADLASQFAQLAGPFLLAGQIEGHLRNLVHGKFPLAEVIEGCAASNDGNGKEITGAADLTLGDYGRLLGKPERWDRFQLNVDRKEFLIHLDAVRKIRNSVMHFNPDGISEDELRILRDSARFLEALVHMGAVSDSATTGFRSEPGRTIRDH